MPESTQAFVGDVIEWVPTAAHSSGDIVSRAGLAVQIIHDVAIGGLAEAYHRNIVTASKDTTEVWVAGDALFWVNASNWASNTAGDFSMGIALQAQLAADTTADVLMNG